MVLDKNLEIRSVMPIPSKITKRTQRVASRLFVAELVVPATKMVAMVMRKGNLPLQGTKALVSIAINFSRGESMIRQPTTPAALQPKPHTKSKCLFSCRSCFLK